MEFLKLTIIKIKAWLLAVASNLWEDYLKDTLKEQIDSSISRGVDLIESYHDSEDYEKNKDRIIDFVFKNVELPIILKPFKGLIKAILSN